MIEIEIRRNDYAIPVNMQGIYAALTAAHIDFDPEERRNSIFGSASDEQPEYVYVDHSDVGKAVKIINEMGYETDEDEGDEED